MKAALNGSFFTAQRMLQEYELKAYGSADTTTPAGNGLGRQASEKAS